jgi:glycosyltransferase involved in cell wall biosynthesis
MKVLLSAYACEPHKGGESGIGWHWAVEVARLGHDVWVLTRANNRQAIEDAGPSLANLRFIYYDLPPALLTLKKRTPFLQCYYALWQWGAYHSIRTLHQRERFDVVQHVTFGVFRHASFMGRLGIPFVFGPVGGGERTPFHLRMDYGFRGHVLDALRDAANLVCRANPWLHETFTAARLILVKTPHTGVALPSRYHQKVRHVIEIGSNETAEQPPAGRSDRSFRFLFVGRLLYWKGLQYGLRAFATLLRDVPNARLTIVGAGPEERRWRRLSRGLGLAHAVEWIGWIPHADVGGRYRGHDVFLFPSLHDSSGTVILEAMSYGLPVVCFDLGGPGVLVNDTCGVVVPTTGRSADELVMDLADAMRTIAEKLELYSGLQAGAFKRSRELTWASAVANVYERQVSETTGLRWLSVEEP